MAQDKPSAGQASAAAIVGRHAVFAEAEAILERYEPVKGSGGQSLATPSQGEMRRALSAIRALLYLVKPVQVSNSPLELVTR